MTSEKNYKSLLESKAYQIQVEHLGSNTRLPLQEMVEQRHFWNQ